MCDVFSKKILEIRIEWELVATIVYLAIVFYNGARAVRALRFGLLHWQSRQRQHYWEIVSRLQQFRVSVSFIDLVVDLVSSYRKATTDNLRYIYLC